MTTTKQQLINLLNMADAVRIFNYFDDVNCYLPVNPRMSPERALDELPYDEDGTIDARMAGIFDEFSYDAMIRPLLPNGKKFDEMFFQGENVLIIIL